MPVQRGMTVSDAGAGSMTHACSERHDSERLRGWEYDTCLFREA